MQWCISLVVLGGHQTLRSGHQKLHQRQVPQLAREMKRSFIFIVLGIDLCISLDQKLGNADVASKD